MTKTPPTITVISTEAERSGEISPSDGTGSITVGDLSTQSIMGAVTVCLSYRHAAPLEMTVAADTIGHTFGVRVQKVQKVQRVQRVVVAASPQAPPSHFPSISLAVLLLSGEGVFFFLRRR